MQNYNDSLEKEIQHHNKKMLPWKWVGFAVAIIVIITCAIVFWPK